MFFESLKALNAQSPEMSFMDLGKLQDHQSAQNAGQICFQDFCAKLDESASLTNEGEAPAAAFLFSEVHFEVRGKIEEGEIEESEPADEDQWIDEILQNDEIELLAFLFFPEKINVEEFKTLQKDFNHVTDHFVQKVQDLLNSFHSESQQKSDLVELGDQLNEMVNALAQIFSHLNSDVKSSKGYLAQLEFAGNLQKFNIDSADLMGDDKSRNQVVSPAVSIENGVNGQEIEDFVDLEKAGRSIQKEWLDTPIKDDGTQEVSLKAIPSEWVQKDLTNESKENVKALKLIERLRDMVNQSIDAEDKGNGQGVELVQSKNGSLQEQLPVEKVYHLIDALKGNGIVKWANLASLPENQVIVKKQLFQEPNQLQIQEPKLKEYSNTDTLLKWPFQAAESIQAIQAVEKRWINPHVGEGSKEQFVDLSIVDNISMDENVDVKAFVWKKGVRIEVQSEKDNSIREEKILEQRPLFSKIGAGETAQASLPGAAVHTVSSILLEVDSSAKSETPLPSYLTKEVVQQVDRQLLNMAEKGIREMTLQLQPAHLGRVEIKMEMDKDQLKVHLKVESDEVKQVVEAQIHRLKESLELQNVNLAKTEVQIFAGDKQNSSSFQDSKKNRKKQNSSFSESPALRETEVEGKNESRQYGYNTVEYTA